jgi:hypothetical protein
VLLVGYDLTKQEAYVQDNSLLEVQTVPLADLKEAWNVNNPGQGKKNTYCIPEFGSRIAPLEEIARLGLKKKAKLMINPPVGFMGIKGMRKLAADIENWPGELTPSQMEKCLSDLVMFTCSEVPMPPQRLLPFPLPRPDSHQAVRDRLSSAMVELSSQFGEPIWKDAAGELVESGILIGKLTDRIVDQLLAKTSNLQGAAPLIKEIADREEKAYTLLL